MTLNKGVKIIGTITILVPYKKKHVPTETGGDLVVPENTRNTTDIAGRYHSWMESEELRQLTASEKLSLEEEYLMQEKWVEDEDKCTFIIIDKEKKENPVEISPGLFEDDSSVDAMIGDANLFLTKEDGVLTGEVSLMIALKEYRYRGRGKEAALHLIRYGIEELNIKKFIAKINVYNEPSISFFKALKFEEVGANHVFDESIFELKIDNEFLDWLNTVTPDYNIEDESDEDE